MKRGLLLKLPPSCFYTGCASRDGGQIVADILQVVRQSKSVDESGEREDKTMKMITGLLVIVAGAIVFNTASAVPRYSVSVPQVGDSNVTHPATESAGVLAQNQKSPVLQRIKQEAQMCNSPQPYVTCAYMRPLDAPVVGKVAEATLGEKGVHWQIVIYNAKTGEQIASYGKTTTPIVQGSSAAGLVAAGAVGAIAGALEGTAYGQGIMTHDDPTNNPEYATYRQEPVWCIGSSEISVLKPGYYEVLDTDCREYAERVKDDLLRNKGGREIPAPEYTILSTSCRKGDMSKRETESTKSKSNDVSDDSEKKSVVPEKKTVSNRVGAANSMSSAAADSGVGVRDWDKLSSCEMNEECNGIEGVCVKLDEGKLDFYSLVPDKIWTEPIIGALIPWEAHLHSTNWWGAKWFGKLHPTIYSSSRCSHGNFEHCGGFAANAGYWFFTAPLEKFSLEDAMDAVEKVKKMIENNTGVKLELKVDDKNDETRAHSRVFRHFQCMVKTEYLSVYFGGHISVEKGKTVKWGNGVKTHKSTIRLDNWSIFVDCGDQIIDDSSRYSVRDLLQGKVKRK